MVRYFFMKKNGRYTPVSNEHNFVTSSWSHPWSEHLMPPGTPTLRVKAARMSVAAMWLLLLIESLPRVHAAFLQRLFEILNANYQLSAMATSNLILYVRPAENPLPKVKVACLR